MRGGVWCAVLGLLAACYAPTTTAGAPCDPDKGNCPSGQRCLTYGGGSFCQPDGFDPDADAAIDTPGMIMIDARADASGNGDQDNDSVADSIDNCPAKANTNQANEDGDPFGDACDPCPPFADGNNPMDLDNDGVSGICDPHPLIGGDKITMFEGFRGGLPGTWETFGSWTPSVQGTAYGMSASLTNGNHATLRYDVPATTNELVAAGITITAVNGTTDYASAGVVALHQNMSDSAIQCGPALYPTDGKKLSLIDTSTENVFEKTNYELEVGTTYTVTLERRGNMHSCASATNGIAEVIADNYTLAASMPEIGVRLKGVAATVNWVAIVTSP